MKKLLSVISLASLVTFSLFAFMAYLVSSDEVGITEPSPEVIVDVYQTKEEKPPQEKVKKLLEPPKAPEPMPQLTTAVETGDGPSIIGTGININVPSTTIGLDNIGVAPDHDARPIVRISPKYPVVAARDGIEGWVQLAFDINSVGEVTNISVVNSEPKRIFDRAAKQALRKWKYKAKSINGEFVSQFNQTVQLDFKMDQQI